MEVRVGAISERTRERHGGETHVRLPAGFLLGSATSAHQVEGGNVGSDWWEWEHARADRAKSLDACDHYHRYSEDVALMRALGLNAFRFSIEWARIEPEEGYFSRAVLAHYGEVIDACRANGIEPVVTLVHQTLPRWFAKRGGWLWEAAPMAFASYCRYVARGLGDRLGWVMTINEPDIASLISYRYGLTPPGISDPATHSAAQAALVACHHAGRNALREVVPGLRVGWGLALQEWEALPGGEQRLARLKHEFEGPFVGATVGDDWVGVQVYTRILVAPEPKTESAAGHNSPVGVATMELFSMYPDGTRRTLMGYEYRPEAVEAVIRRAAKETKLPVLVTENGISTHDDEERCAFIRVALAGLVRCLADGLDVRGYLHWSFLDNFEWLQGYTQPFGLVEVEPETFRRRPKASANLLGSIARSGRLSRET
jgi:beta-glucosidase